MVKQPKNVSRKKRSGKGLSVNHARVRKINASIRFETCCEQLSRFGGLLARIKFFELIDFREFFYVAWRSLV